MKTKILLAMGVTLSLSAFAQTNSQTACPLEHMDHTPTFRVTVVSRNVQAVNYKHRSGASKVDFAGTDLMAAANGEAKVEQQKGLRSKSRLNLATWQNPTTFGNEYLTYVLWAISPEGRAVNLGEMLVGDNHRSKVVVTTDLQAFALIVTAEPYYAVRQPSNVVVIENVVRDDTKGTTETVNAKYELMERGGYIPTGYKFDPVVLNARLPLEFFEARNAMRIAQSEGAEQYASDSYQHAVQLMNNADEYATRKHIESKPLIAFLARQSRHRKMRAPSRSRNSMKYALRTNVRIRRMLRRNRRDRLMTRCARKNKPSPTRRERKPQRPRPNRIRKTHSSPKPRQSRMQPRHAPMLRMHKMRPHRPNLIWQTARLLRLLLFRQPRRTRINPAWPHSSPRRVRNKRRLTKPPCARELSEQLNSILQTRDSARGLIVSMSDVLFDTGKYSLKSGAREKLAKVAGILLAYPVAQY